MRWIEKLTDTFVMGTTYSITVQSLRKIEQCKNVEFVCFLSVCHAPSPAGCSSGIGLYFKQVWVDFDAFFRSDCPFRSARGFLFSSLDGATIFAKLRSKLQKV